jgi:acyl-CoA synthetase (AMP-forming)/AMP-acid ligase II
MTPAETSNAFRNPRPLMPDVWAGHARWRPNQPAVTAESGALSWRELMTRAAQVGRGLQGLGLAPGDRVGLLMANDLAYVEALVGVMAAGFVAVPLNPGVADSALSVMLADAGASAIFATPEHAPRLAPPSSIRDGALLCAGEAPGGAWRDYASWRSQQSAAPLETPAADALCNIIYSSGTTGTPKGIVHTHGQRMAWAEDVSLALRFYGGCRGLTITGLHSNITWATMLPTFHVGGTLVVRRSFEPQATLSLIEAFGITNFSAVPMQYQRILECGGFDAVDTSRLRAMMCCGSPLPEMIKRAWIERFPTGFIELFGSTEGVATTLDPEEAPGRMRSVGRPPPGAEIVVLGADDRPVACGETGEIAGRSRWMMDGYWRRPEATAEAMWIDDQGRPWLRTGDIGRLDEDGYLYVFDRKKDMILSGGQNVYPADIEAIVAEHPEVFDCAVIGAPHPKWGETPVAVVVRREAATVDGETLAAWTNARLGKFQRLSRVVFAEALPRNVAGKVLKRELRESLATAADAEA